MATNVEITRGNSEHTASLIRRFTKRIRNSGILPRMRSIRYYKRHATKLTVKKQRLKSLERKAKYEELVKLGKMPEQPIRTRKRR